MRRTLLTATLIVTLATGCSAVRGERITTGYADRSSTSLTDASETSASTLPAPVSSAANGSAIDFSAPMLIGGQRVDGIDLLSQHAIVTFVQPGCEISVADGSSIADAADRHPELTYVFVHSGGGEAGYLDMVDTAGLVGENIVHLVDDGRITERFGVIAFPTTVIVDADGALSRAVGALDAEGQERAAHLATG